MNLADCTTVSETLKGFLPMNILGKAIEETRADHGTKKFTVLRQLNTLMYAQLNPKEGLRHIVSDIQADEKLQEHTGTISYSQLSRKNSERDPLIFQTGTWGQVHCPRSSSSLIFHHYDITAMHFILVKIYLQTDYSLFSSTPKWDK
jgi:hypothetical protein